MSKKTSAKIIELQAQRSSARGMDHGRGLVDHRTTSSLVSRSSQLSDRLTKALAGVKEVIMESPDAERRAVMMQSCNRLSAALTVTRDRVRVGGAMLEAASRFEGSK
jgi:hypothetical protein